MTRIRRLCIFTLVSLLSLFGLAAQAGAQDNVPNQRSGAPKSQAKTEETHKAKVKIPDTPSGYTYSVLYSFGTGSADGSYPEAGLTQDSEGNLYGTTADGIYNYAGSVFEVNTTGQETVLYFFCPAGGNCTDGDNPWAGLVQKAGNLYGTTVGGGNPNSDCQDGDLDGCGTVFKVDNTGQETVLHGFCSAANCTDGDDPRSGLILDDAGNLYGTTTGGGNSNSHCHNWYGGDGCGTVFKVDNTDQETVLYSFCAAANCTDGANPLAGLIQDSAGNLYGTTEYGGANNGGTVFKLDNTGHETVLYSFCSASACADGEYPYASLVMDTAGDLYGTTYGGGNYNSLCPYGGGGCGTVFKLDNAGHYAVLYTFCSAANCTDGGNPRAGLIMDAAGNLYGTTQYGGANDDPGGFGGGAVFEVDNTGKETVLYSFCSAENCTDGYAPAAGLIQDRAGNLYGTANFGGAFLRGTVFKLASNGGPAVALSRTSLKFGKTEVGFTSAAKKVILTNSGNETLNIATVSASGDFALATVKATKKVAACVNGSAVAAGAKCEIKVTFTPTQTGTLTGDVTFTDNAANSPQQLPLTGTGKD